MRVDKDFHAIFTAPFYVGDTTISIDPGIEELDLGVGEWWYGEIVDEQCSYFIKVERTTEAYVITQGVCGTEPCDIAAGACLDPSPCGDCCDALDADEDECYINNFVSDDLDFEQDPEDCHTAIVNIKDGVIPEVPEFCFLNAGNLVNHIKPQSIIFFCENGVKFGILFSDLCADLAACTGGDGDVTINNEYYLDVSDVNVNLCGMVIENGVIQSVPPDWCDNFVTEAELLAAIAGIDVGVESLGVTSPIENTGTSTNPVIGLIPIYGSNQVFFGGALTTDRWGRVTSAQTTVPWVESISGDPWISVSPTNALAHEYPSVLATTLGNGVGIDATGHVTGLDAGYRIARWTGDASSFSTQYAKNMTASLGVGIVNFTFAVPMPHANYHIDINDLDSTPSNTIVTNKSVSGFSIPNTTGPVTIFVHE